MNAAWAAVTVVASFFIGSIPFGLVVSTLFYRRDIRQTGSGNIGAMNALRALGKRGAVAVLLLDAAKGALPVAYIFWPEVWRTQPPAARAHEFQLAAIVAAAAILGHCFSPWLRFKGGKGVATFLGTLAALCWPAALVFAAGWLVGALITAFSSVGSILGSIAAAAALWFFTRDPWLTGYGFFAAALILFTHRENVARVRAGQEKGIPFLQRNRRGS